MRNLNSPPIPIQLPAPLRAEPTPAAARAARCDVVNSAGLIAQLFGLLIIPGVVVGLR